MSLASASGGPTAIFPNTCPAARSTCSTAQVLPHVVCVPPDNMLVLGELADTLPRSVEQHHSGVALVHTDIGTADLAYGVKTASFICKHLAGALAPGGIVAERSGTAPATSGAAHASRRRVAPGRYFMYRAPSASTA